MVEESTSRLDDERDRPLQRLIFFCSAPLQDKKNMIFNRLGSSGLQVSKFSYGGWLTGALVVVPLSRWATKIARSSLLVLPHPRYPHLPIPPPSRPRCRSPVPCVHLHSRVAQLEAPRRATSSATSSRPPGTTASTPLTWPRATLLARASARRAESSRRSAGLESLWSSRPRRVPRSSLSLVLSRPCFSCILS